jgi:hypothetical protein
MGDMNRWLDSSDLRTNECLLSFAFKCEITIIASGQPWLFNPHESAAAVKGINATSNISGGVGFLGGIATTRIPFEDCLKKVLRPPAFGIRVYCEITYDANSASVEGWVLDQCRGTPVDNPTIVLTEVDGDNLRIFDANSTGGSYSMGGLVPGRAYSYQVQAAGYVPLTGDIAFQSGERVDMDFSLSHTTRACD